MPELPDVEILKRYLNATSLHQTVDQVEIEAPRILKDISEEKFYHSVVGKRFDSTDRHGKYLFIKLNKEGLVVMHFGMTGDLKYFKKLEEKPEFTKALFEFENDFQLALIMPRKLGELHFIRDKEDFISKKELGPDVMSEDFSFSKFKEVLSGRRGMIKSALMNQQIMAGIGNVYSDEILYHARIHPKKSVNHLNDDELREIFEKMEMVLKTAIKRNANPDEFPDSFITSLRGTAGANCPSCKGELKKIKVSGRSGYFCPNCQKE